MAFDSQGPMRLVSQAVSKILGLQEMPMLLK